MKPNGRGKKKIGNGSRNNKIKICTPAKYVHIVRTSGANAPSKENRVAEIVGTVSDGKIVA